MKPATPRIALIHATALAVDPIQAAFRQHWPQARCMNVLDDSLSVDQAQAKTLTPAMVQRFVDLAMYTRRAGCTGILFTCSAFGLAIEAARDAVQLPTLKPNEAMFEEALNLCPQPGARLGLIATFDASLAPMSIELQTMATQRQQTIELVTAHVPEAMQDLANGHAEQHHRKVAAAARSLRDCRVVMLAQFSMAAARQTVQAELPCPVLSSPDCAVLLLQKRLLYV